MTTIQFRAGDDRFPMSHSWEDLQIERTADGYKFTTQGEEITPAQALACMEAAGNLDEDQDEVVTAAMAWCRTATA